MEIIEYFTTIKKEHWLNEIKKCDWGAGQYLYQLLCENNLKKMVGETALVPMLVEGERLIAFCTFAPLDYAESTATVIHCKKICNQPFLEDEKNEPRHVFLLIL